MLNQQHPPRQGDVQAMLRLMQPLDGSGAASGSADPSQRKRRLLADLCRLIGDEVNGNSAATRNERANGNGNGHGRGDHGAHPGDSDSTRAIDVKLRAQCLPRRMEQTLRSLLGGDSEKQVAAKLGLSQHTVHVYVKQIYKKYGVSTRAELLARWLQS
jgi:DNA-binding NarL/FixJ family response regulator